MFGLGHYLYAGESFPEKSGTPAPASNASPSDDADPKLGSQPIEIPNYKEVLKAIIPCGGSKGKTYQETYTDNQEEVLKAGKRFGGLSNPSPDQSEHLANLRVMAKHHMQNNNGVLA